jgi:AcrR family transcriptional regulator
MARPTSKKADKDQNLRNEIADVAIRLFLANGFEQTTVDAIADAAGVSRRSMFRYFESKKDMALAWTTATDPDLVNQLLELDSSKLIQPIEAALSALMRHVNLNRAHYPISLAVGQLIDRTPSLRARTYEKYLAWEELLGNALITQGAALTDARMAAAVA